MHLQQRHLRALFALAATTNEEVCGVLIGTRAPQITIDTIIAGRNIHPTPQHHFTLDAQTLLQADAEARAAGRDIVGFFHSHPNGSAFPSRHDRRDAWPGYVYLIVVLAQDRPRYLAAWICDQHRRFRPEPIAFIQDPESAV